MNQEKTEHFPTDDCRSPTSSLLKFLNWFVWYSRDLFRMLNVLILRMHQRYEVVRIIRLRSAILRLVTCDSATNIRFRWMFTLFIFSPQCGKWKVKWFRTFHFIQNARGAVWRTRAIRSLLFVGPPNEVRFTLFVFLVVKAFNIGTIAKRCRWKKRTNARKNRFHLFNWSRSNESMAVADCAIAIDIQRTKTMDQNLVHVCN